MHTTSWRNKLTLVRTLRKMDVIVIVIQAGVYPVKYCDYGAKLFRVSDRRIGHWGNRMTPG
ncbi:hypothetical protein AB3R30_10885 [Leptolyngbyaceae cyanobacterium UHCC 1019]